MACRLPEYTGGSILFYPAISYLDLEAAGYSVFHIVCSVRDRRESAGCMEKPDKDSLLQARDQLEAKVAERTSELEKANEALARCH